MSHQSVPFEARIQALTDRILADYGNERVIDRLEMFTQPDRLVIEALIEKLFRLVFPGYYRDYTYRIYNPKNNLSALIEDIAFHLNRQIGIALRGSSQAYGDGIDRATEDLTAAFLEKLPEIRAYVETDLQAAYDGDPAASDKAEVIIAYPGMYAITVYRLAHVLYQLEVPLIPRIMTEYAHSRTGIDIHPGAQIGRYFFIDHGTGIVVGETSIIGDHVKLYQGATLGALSPAGMRSVPGERRHPKVGNNVTIYAGSTLLGGATEIGDNVVIGGNAFLTSSVEADTTVSIKKPEMTFRGKHNPNHLVGK
jgi:serine O-acetyltransferase